MPAFSLVLGTESLIVEGREEKGSLILAVSSVNLGSYEVGDTCRFVCESGESCGEINRAGILPRLL
jgi:hypothetical protein